MECTDCPVISVEWFPGPVDCLVPAVTAFQEFVEQCKFPLAELQGYSLTIRLVLDSSEKVAPITTSRGMSNTSIETLPFSKHASTWSEKLMGDTDRDTSIGCGKRRLAARHPIRVLNDDPLLRSRIGFVLRQRKLLIPICLGIIVTLILCYILLPRRALKVFERPDAPPIIFEKEYTSALMLTSVLNLAIFIVVCHYLSRGMLQLTTRSFDAWFMCINQVVEEGVNCYNIICLSLAAEEASAIWIIAAVVRGVCSCLAGLGICHVDALIISRLWKVVIYCLYVSMVGFNYYTSRFGGLGWTTQRLCWYHGCTSPQYIYQMTLVNICVFVLKAMILNLRGWEFAFISSRYAECRDRSEAAQLLKHFIEHEELNAVGNKLFSKGLQQLENEAAKAITEDKESSKKILDESEAFEATAVEAVETAIATTNVVGARFSL